MPVVPRPPGTRRCIHMGRWSIPASQYGPSEIVVVTMESDV